MIEFIRPIAYLHPYILQILFAEVLFMPNLTRRDHFLLRVLVTIPLYIVLGAIIPAALYGFAKGFLSMAIFLLSLTIFPLLFKINFADTLFYGIAAMAIQNLTYCLISVICVGFDFKVGVNLPFSLVSSLTYLLIYVCSYFILARRIKKKESPSVDKVPLISICTASLAITYLFQWFFSNQEKTKITNLIVTSLFAYIDLVCLLILFVLRTRSQLKEENRLLEQVISSDAKEYENSKENMEIINMKFHDIKHEIYLLKSDSNPDELKEVEDSIQLYDNMPKTGNKVLNVILTKELLICEKRNIKFTYMIEAKDLSVFLPTDLNSLFINLIDNAIEYLSNIKDETKRMMSLRVQSHSNLLSIHIENYFEGNVKFENGLPITTKGDKETHGLGLKSVRYIISKYDGNMVIGTKESYFIVDILIPIKNV